jgi:hypothetical protein
MFPIQMTYVPIILHVYTMLWDTYEINLPSKGLLLRIFFLLYDSIRKAFNFGRATHFELQRQRCENLQRHE